MLRRFAALAFALGLVAMACTSKNDTGSSGSAGASGSGEPILIGFPADLSTDWSYYDSPMEEGAQFAIDQINASGGLLGRQLQLKTIDMRNDVAQGAKVTQQLIDEGAALPDRHRRGRDPGRGIRRMCGGRPDLHRTGNRSVPRGRHGYRAPISW